MPYIFNENYLKMKATRPCERFPNNKIKNHEMKNEGLIKQSLPRLI